MGQSPSSSCFGAGDTRSRASQSSRLPQKRPPCPPRAAAVTAGVTLLTASADALGTDTARLVRCLFRRDPPCLWPEREKGRREQTCAGSCSSSARTLSSRPPSSLPPPLPPLPSVPHPHPFPSPLLGPLPLLPCLPLPPIPLLLLTRLSSSFSPSQASLSPREPHSDAEGNAGPGFGGRGGPVAGAVLTSPLPLAATARAGAAPTS